MRANNANIWRRGSVDTTNRLDVSSTCCQFRRQLRKDQTMKLLEHMTHTERLTEVLVLAITAPKGRTAEADALAHRFAAFCTTIIATCASCNRGSAAAP